MREWNLGPADPLELTISADFRLCTPDYVNDHIWELVMAGGEPPALALRTSFGARARSMQIFPRFAADGRAVSDPAEFFTAPRLRRLHPNFLMLEFSPFEAIDVTAEYWVPGSHECAGRFSITNRSKATVLINLEICAQLIPLEAGHPMTPMPMQSSNILVGQTGKLAPVLFMTGGPQPGLGPYPSLMASRSLEPEETRTLTWAQAALGNLKESFELARLTAAQPWEAARARIELVNAAQSIEVFTGDPEWDAALALGQKTALRLLFNPSGDASTPSFVGARQPDQGYSPRGDGSDYPPSWKAQVSADAHSLASLLPGAAESIKEIGKKLFFIQASDKTTQQKGGERGERLAAPFLTSLAWRVYAHSGDLEFLRENQGRLGSFVERWFTVSHDRDGDGFPEWDHLFQSGFEDNPAFSAWQMGGQGAQISTAESPTLAALLCQECRCLAWIAEALNQPEEQRRWTSKADSLARLTEECWDERTGHYRLRDRDSHSSPGGKVIARLRGQGETPVDKIFKEPLRLLVRLDLHGHATTGVQVDLAGLNGDIPVQETFERADFQWGTSMAVATSRSLFTTLKQVGISGNEKRDRVSIQVMDLSGEDITLFTPLWAHIPEAERADSLCRALLAPDRFGKPFGIPASPNSIFMPGRKIPPEVLAGMDRTNLAVHLPWNALVIEGLLQYGWRREASQLYYRLMTAVIRNLKSRRAFFAAYHAETGEGMGERGSIRGLPPVGLFLEILGVRILSPRRVRLSGKNPYPWPVTVKYRGLMVTRQADQTVVVFPDGQSTTLADPTDAIVSID